MESVFLSSLSVFIEQTTLVVMHFIFFTTWTSELIVVETFTARYNPKSALIMLRNGRES